MTNRRNLIALAVAVGVCALSAALDSEQFYRSALFAFFIWLNVSLGALTQLTMHHLTGGRWGFVVRRILEAALVPLPAMAVLFAILFAGLPALRHGTGYFHPNWMIARAVIYFAIWLWLAWKLRSWSLEQDRRFGVGDFEPARKLRLISGPGLVLYFITMGFAMIDWVMELEPGWRSTMFPVIIIANQTLLALSGATIAAVIMVSRGFPKIEALATTQAWHDLGKLLFAYVIFWTYVSFSQLLIIWSGNLPHESVWYMHRSRGGWEWLSWGLGAICFVAPAAVLLFQAPKKNPRSLAKAAALIWVAQIAYLFWVIAPAFFPAFHLHWMDLVIPLAVGIVWAVGFWHGFSTAEPVPLNDPRLEELEVEPV